MKDNFSAQADKYSRFRPQYPMELYDILLSLVPDRKMAWDCGTGNGQVAQELAIFFDQVMATDISQEQIRHAPPNNKIIYSIQKAENTSFSENSFDLITVAQAIHWFDFDQFYKEVNRTIKDNGILAVIGYGLIQTFKEADEVIEHFYHHIVGPYWDKERRYIDHHYKTIPFPFYDLKNIDLESKFEWSLEHLIGYLHTWSALKHYQNEKNQDPIDFIYKDLENAWGHKTRTVTFPILLRVGKIKK
jgi:SAM-dependent methyltransferase